MPVTGATSDPIRSMGAGAAMAWPSAGEPIPGGIDGIRSDGAGLLRIDDDAIAAARRRTVRALGHASTVGLPALDAAGDLPPGVHAASQGEFLARFGGTDRRDRLLDQLQAALRAMRRAGVEHVIVGGSLVSSKARPGDIDLAWIANATTTTDPVNDALRRIRILVPQVSAHRADRIVDNVRSVAGAVPGETFLELYQHDRIGRQRGVVLLSTADEALDALGTFPSLREGAAQQAMRGLRALTIL